MKIILKKNREPVERLYRRYASLKLQLALRRFNWLVDSVSVYMHEEAMDGLRKRKKCKLLIHTVQGGIVVESSKSVSGLLAINRVVGKTVHSLQDLADQLQMGNPDTGRGAGYPAPVPVVGGSGLRKAVTTRS